jgi:hypothetical protein
MAHIAMLEVDENGSPAVWSDHISNAEYAVSLRSRGESA